MEYREFYQQCAIAAMQGLQESGIYLGTFFDLTPKILAKRAFSIAEAMIEELIERDSKNE